MGTPDEKYMFVSFHQQSFLNWYLVNIYQIIIICDTCQYCAYLLPLFDLPNWL